MSRQSVRVLALAFVCAVPSLAAALPGARPGQSEQQAPPKAADQRDGKQADEKRPEPRRWMWWRIAETKAEIGISDQQAAEIDQIFQAAIPSLRAAKEELDKLDAEVAQVIKGSIADDATVERLVGRAEHARARLTTTRTVMLYRMHRVLSADQRSRLNAMFERWEAERRKTTTVSSPRR